MTNVVYSLVAAVCKVSGYSRQQLTLLIAQYRKTPRLFPDVMRYVAP